MATPTIPNGPSQFFPIIYEGNGGGQKVGTFVPFTDNGTVDNSCIFNKPDTAALTKTYGSEGTKTAFTMSCWIKPSLQTTYGYIFGASTSADSWNASTTTSLYFDTNTLVFYSGGTTYIKTNRTFEDAGKWYHICLAVNTGGSGTDKVKLYIDGVQQTSFATDNRSSISGDMYIGDDVGHFIGGQVTTGTTSAFWDGYIAEFNYIDGSQLAVSTFGVTDTSTGRWIPKALTGITYGSNGCRLKFQDSSSLGDDTGGGTNDWTAQNLASTDQTTDSPTQNFNNMGGSNSGSFTLTEGNLKVVIPGTGAYNQCLGRQSFGVDSGKWYWEVKINVKGASGYGWKSDEHTGGAVANSSAAGSNNLGIVYNVGGSGGFADGEWVGDWQGGTSDFSTFTTASVDDVVIFAIDLDNGKGYVGLNGTWFNSANPASGTGSIGLGKPARKGNKFYPMCIRLDATGTGTYNFGSKSFAHTAPTGFSALQQDNLPESSKGVSGLAWTKNRDALDSHQLYDSSRGVQKDLQSDAINAESTTVNGLCRFLKGGQQIEDDVSVNTSGESYVSWNWVGNSGTTATNAEGSILSTVQANTTAGFSIVQYTGTGSAATIGHGLSVAPSVIMVKNLSTTDAWKVYHSSMASDPETDYLVLNTTAVPVDDATVWNDTAPTSTVFSIGNHTDVNTSSENYVAYCWSTVDGFSKFSSYNGNNNADGSFIYTGFKPALVICKGLTTATGWTVWDSARSSINPVDKALFWNTTGLDDTGNTIDFLSNGFKLRSINADFNGSYSYGYLSFAEHPFNGDGTNPVTAR